MTKRVASCRDFADVAVSLIRQAWQECDISYGAGSMSCAVYDTAWTSMVAKTVVGEKRWLFPQSFDYLISTQSEDGSWAVTTTSPPIDGILGTAASLLSLQAHYSEPLNTTATALDGIEDRIRRAAVSLNSQLSDWDVHATLHVGFEIIVPTLLKLLRGKSSSTILKFAGEKVLDQINAAKMSRFKPKSLYGKKPFSALHSLEAFIGTLEFDKLAHHKIKGSMMGSPASTSAYLMNVSEWDQEAEAYLSHVVRASAGKNGGAVPSAFPSMFFEYTWMLSTMLRAGIVLKTDCCPELTAMVAMLRSAFNEGQGIIGFAPGLPADVDDTAKCIISLNRLGEKVSAAGMIAAFEAETHFRTYPSELNTSFTANCNVLSALLEQPDPSRYLPQITKTIEFLCRSWWASDGSVKDKWNLSCFYSSMLAIQAFGDLFTHIEQGTLARLHDDILSRVHITMFQICLRTLLRNSTPKSTEETAYRVLILCEAKRFTLFDSLETQIDADIKAQVKLLNTLSDSKTESDDDRLWIEKVSFSSQLLTKSYKIAAMMAASCPASRIGAQCGEDVAAGIKNGRTYVKMLKQTPLFADTPEWQVEASLLEALLFQPLLRRRRLDIFPRKDMAPDNYFDIIPLTWTGCNNRTNAFASTNFIFEMMIISFLDFQADEFMEAVAGELFRGQMDSLRTLVDDVFRSLEGEDVTEVPNKRRRLSKPTGTESKVPSHKKGDQDEARGPLTRFVNYIAEHHSVQSASPWDRSSTLRELQIYLHAHVTQSEDNERLAKVRSHLQPIEKGCDCKSSTTPIVADRSYFRWVRTTSADHTACPYSFAFAGCLLSAQLNGAESIPSSRGKYLAAAACQYLATMCRMYNDYGSIARDRAECNLNSVDFDEFRILASRLRSKTNDGDEEGLDNATVLHGRKQTLLELAQYERSCLSDAMRRLKQEMREEKMSRQWEILTMFCDVTDLYGQIYVVKDIASRMTNRTVSRDFLRKL